VWVYVARAQGVALLFKSAMKTWAKCVYMGQEFAVNNIIRSYGSESQFAINDDRGARLRSTICDPKIITSLVCATIFSQRVKKNSSALHTLSWKMTDMTYLDGS